MKTVTIALKLMFLTAVSVAAFLSAGCVAGRGETVGVATPPFLRTADGTRAGFNEMLVDLGSSQLIFIGELHDNPGHHQIQLEVIKWLHRSGAKLAIGMEMFRAESQQQLDRWTNGSRGLLEFMEVYRDNWSLPWGLYDSIFLYARNNGIPIVGLNAPDSIMRKVYRHGFSALSPDEKKLLPGGVTCSVDTSYMKFVRRNFVWHSTDESMFIHFCEAQLLRDKVMAHHLSEYMRGNPERIVVVLAGVGHAMRRGVPDELAPEYQGRMKILMPLLHETAAESLDKGDADYLATQ